ncbi:MAG: crossover junction endodeoxyribonuclease RuvC [Candidatus Atribacteria bacterium]|nr:crossover junction endodeoxyribonuclease RuvC [Candidatus Atribacteria bacterium]
MKLLGIDPGIQAWGVAVVDNSAVLLLATFPLRYEPTPYSFLYDTLTNLIIEHNPQVVVCEGTFVNSTAFAHQQAIGIVRAVTERNQVSCHFSPPTHWKKVLFGKGWMKKREVVNALTARGY